ncbi:MAG: translation initiation factor [Calditrichia bacterium]
MKKNSRSVYSTESGRVKEEPKKKKTEKSDGVVRVQREVKGRRGKTVTTITGIPLFGAELLALVKELKQCVGGGGSLKDGVVLLQGDHCDVVVKYLSEKGFNVKRSGG